MSLAPEWDEGSTHDPRTISTIQGHKLNPLI
jgi:hypothetical protein